MIQGGMESRYTVTVVEPSGMGDQEAVVFTLGKRRYVYT